MSENSVCEYPPCTAPATGSRGVVMQPEPIAVGLCDEHIAVLEANTTAPGTEDFWRWFDAMSGMRG